MYSTASTFKWLNIQTQRHQSRPYYAARLHARLGRQTIGLGSDEIQALSIAQKLDAEIERTIANGEDLDLERLKSFVTALKQPKPTGTQLKIVAKDDLAILWKKYTDFHIALGTWEQTYVLTHIKTVASLLDKCPHRRLEDRNDLIQWLLQGRSPQTAKSRFTLITACVDWNSKQGNIPRKWGIEYRDSLEAIKLKSKKEKKEISIFSVKEVYEILGALQNETFSRFEGKHRQYYEYTYFCWLTGCRPSEAIALKWENVNLVKNTIRFAEGQVDASGTIVKKSGCKTERYRSFPINAELKLLLESIPHRKGYVFLNSDGEPISQHAFNRVWQFVLRKLGIPHRVPYQLRHTMISYHANNDFPIQKLAELVGNSSEIIVEHYLHLDIERIRLPEILCGSGAKAT